MLAEQVEPVTFAQASNQALAEAMDIDERVILLGEDIADPQGGGVAKVTSGLSTKYGTSRVRTTPISEQAIVGAAVGAAVAGMIPVAEIMMMNFITVAMDQLVNHAAKLRYMSGGQTPVPLTVRTTSGPGLGLGGQHSDMLEAWFAHTPGLKVVVASTPADAKALLYASVFDDDPCLVIEPSAFFFGGVKGPPPPPGYTVRIGSANVERTGTDATVISYGRMMTDVREAADMLASEGIEVEVVDLRTISPLDRAAILESASKTRRVVVVHEAVRSFGVGAEVSAIIHEELFGALDAPVVRLGSAFVPVPRNLALEAAMLPNAATIVQAVRRLGA